MGERSQPKRQLEIIQLPFWISLEQPSDLAVLVHVDLFGGGDLGQTRHGPMRRGRTGTPDLIQIVRNEFGRFQGFAWGKTLVRRTCGGMTMPVRTAR